MIEQANQTAVLPPQDAPEGPRQQGGRPRALPARRSQGDSAHPRF